MNRICYVSILGILSLALSSQAFAQDASPETSESKITSVSQLADIQTSDWAFQALQSLVERYGCIAGYPDKFFRGNRTLTRYEFAAGLNACSDKIQELITATTSDRAKKEDLATLQKLQEEFAAELATLRERVNALETRTATVEKQRFSTTTKLSGQTVLAVNGSTRTSAASPNITFFYRGRLNLLTSLSGRDVLLTQLQTGDGNSADAAGFSQQENGTFRRRLAELGEVQLKQQFERIFGPSDDSPANLGLGLADLQTVDEVRDTYIALVRGFNEEEKIPSDVSLSIVEALRQKIEAGRSINRFLQVNSSLDYANNVASNLSVNRLSYTFPIGTDAKVSLFPQAYLSDFVDANPYANNSTTNFSTYGLINNQILLAGDMPGAGAALSWNPGGGAFTLRAAYRAEQRALINTDSIFGGSSNDQRGETASRSSGIFTSPNLGVVELEIAPSEAFTFRVQYSHGIQADSTYSALGVNANLALSKHIGIFGRFGYAFDFPGEIQAIGWSAGLAFLDVFKSGDTAGISIGQPLVLQNNLLGLFNATQTNYEAFYRFPLNDNITISPLIQVITNPGNLKTDTIFTATLRTVFSF